MTWRRAFIGVAVLYVGALLVGPLIALLARAVSFGLTAIAHELLSEGALHAMGLSLVLAGAAVVVNGVFGVLGAIVLTRQRFVGRAFVDGVVDVTLAVSPVMLGLGLLLVFGRGGWARPLLDPLHIKVTFAFSGLLLCTLFVTLPFTMREVAYVLEALGTDEEQVAATLGASPWQTFRRVTLPNIGEALRLGITLTAARALGEFGAVLVVGGAITGRTQTATTYIYAAIDERRDAAALGMALALAAASMILMAAVQRFGRRNHEPSPV